MGFPALAGEFDLALAFAQTFALPVAQAPVAFWAGNALFIIRGGQVFFRQGPSAAEAKYGLSVLQSMGDRDLMMEDKAFAFPLAFLRVDFFQIMEDPTPQMIDLVEPVLQKVG